MRNKIVAVTGGIGSGKSTVCKAFKNLGCLVFSADEIYSELLKDKSVEEANIIIENYQKVFSMSFCE